MSRQVLLKESSLERESQGRPGYVDFWRSHGRSMGGVLAVDLGMYARLREHFARGGEVLATPLVIPAQIQHVTISRGLSPVSRKTLPGVMTEKDRWRVKGRQMWAELHHRPARPGLDGFAETEWLNRFTARIGCGECLASWLTLIGMNPPDLRSPFSYFIWTVEAHNAVNARINVEIAQGLRSDPLKPLLPVSHAVELYQRRAA